MVDYQWGPYFLFNGQIPSGGAGVGEGHGLYLC